MRILNKLIEKAIDDYLALSAEINEINRVIDGQTTLEELYKKYKGVQIDYDSNLFDCLYGSIYVTIYEIYSPIGRKFNIGQTVEVYNDNGEYIRDLSEEELKQ